MRRRLLFSISLPLLFLAAPVGARGQLEPAWTYFGVNRPAPCRVSLDDAGDAGELELVLFDPVGERVVERAPIVPEPTPEAGVGAVDLASVFPVLWTARVPRLLYVQLIAGGIPTGAPVVLEPMLSPRRFQDRLSADVIDAFARRDAEGLTRLLALSTKAREDRAGELVERPSEPVFSGRRAYVLRDVVLETSEGTMRIALAPDAAPTTVFRFLALVEGGFYRDMAFHRVISADASGLPFIVQTGDPTGTGLGGSGELADFEPSELRHARGVVSMARRPDDPNTNSAQFFICLSRAACAKLDGRYTSFGTVVEGLETLDAIAATPLAPAEEEGQTIAQRPIRPPVMLEAIAVDAAPVELVEDATPRSVESPRR